MSQLILNLDGAIREEFVPPANSLRLNTSNVEVKRFRKGQSQDLSNFCSRYHYLHKGDNPKQVIYSRAYGLYLGGELAGVAVYNVPGSSAVEKSIFEDYEYQKGTLALTRLCCSPDAPFNSESHLLSQSIRLLEQDNRERLEAFKPSYKTVVTYADYGGLNHTGTIYRSMNAWFIGATKPKALAGFRHKETGEIISIRQGKNTLTKEEAPEGFEPFDRTQKFKYLLFIGGNKEQLNTMRNLKEEVKFRSRFGEFYAWTKGRLLQPSDTRAYDEIYNLAGRKGR